MRTLFGLAVLAAVVAFPLPARAQEGETMEGAITGSMDIDFQTRTKLDRSGQYLDGSPQLGVQDRYSFTLRVAQTTEYAGVVTRQPNIYSRTLRVRKQAAALNFDVALSVLNPRNLNQRKTVGKWTGLVPINTDTGAFELAGDPKGNNLRIAVETVGAAPAFSEGFGGRLVGKAEKKDNLASYTYKRIVGNKTVEMVVKKTDPMKFENIVLAKGPAEIYPRTTVSGRLDYDYDTGNYLTDGIRFRYSLDGKDYEDVVTGSIKWVPDANRKSNGKGQYEFNLRFNEAKYKPAASEAAAFDTLKDEEAFFSTAGSYPGLTGTVVYEDKMLPGKEEPASSKVTYNLKATKMTKQQVVAFAKLWLVCVGPTNDE